MCLPAQAALSSSEVSGGAFKLYACYCAHREGFEVNIKNEQIHAETGLGYAYISTLKFELLEAGWIGLSKTSAKGIIPLKGFEGAAEHIRTERKLSKIERTSDKKPSNIESNQGKVSTIESPAQAPEKLSKNERILSDEVSKNETNPPEPFENQKVTSGTKVAPSKAKNTSTEESQATPETAAEGAAAEDWGEIGRERGLMLETLKSILGAIPAPQAERAACNWLLKNREKLNATTADFIECLREQADEVRDGTGRRKVSWMTVKAEFRRGNCAQREASVSSKRMESFAETSTGLTSRREPSDRIETRAPHSPSRPNDSGRQRKRYEAAVSLMIVEAFEIVDLPVPDATAPAEGGPSEFERKVGYWANMLLPSVPLDDLRPAFDAACSSHADARRPVNPVDVKQAYGELLTRREREKRAAVERENLDDREGGCSFCGPERVAAIFFPATGKEVVAPCRECRPAAFSIFMAQYYERHAPEEGTVAQVLKAGRKLLGEDLRCDNPQCGRTVNTYMTTHRAGGRCGNLLNRFSSDEGEPELCEGIFQAA